VWPGPIFFLVSLRMHFPPVRPPQHLGRSPLLPLGLSITPLLIENRKVLFFNERPTLPSATGALRYSIFFVAREAYFSSCPEAHFASVEIVRSGCLEFQTVNLSAKTDIAQVCRTGDLSRSVLGFIPASAWHGHTLNVSPFRQ